MSIFFITYHVKDDFYFVLNNSKGETILYGVACKSKDGVRGKIDRLRDVGAHYENFQQWKKPDNTWRFSIHYKNGRIIASSNIFNNEDEMRAEMTGVRDAIKKAALVDVAL